MKWNSLKILRFFIFAFGFLGVSQLAASQSCKNDRDCPRGFTCQETSSGRGVCVIDNNRQCSNNGQCPTGWTCRNGTCSKGSSGQSCTSNGHCKTGYVCCANRCRWSTCSNLGIIGEGQHDWSMGDESIDYGTTSSAESIESREEHEGDQ